MNLPASSRRVVKPAVANRPRTKTGAGLFRGLRPLFALIAREADVTQEDVSVALGALFGALYQHPVMRHTEWLTRLLRRRRWIPDEQSTEELIRFVVEQIAARSPIAIPENLLQEFWRFFNELFASPELKGLGELSLDMIQLVVRTYEPMYVEIINLLKAGRRFNSWQLAELGRRAAIVRNDVAIVRRQLVALRYVRQFFQADPRDFQLQAQIVAAMVREFGPFFVKLAQVAAANSDFLPLEIAQELAVFHENVDPMAPEEVEAAFLESFGHLPSARYIGFDAARPLRSGSIGSVYLAKKPFWEDGREVLHPVVIKVGRPAIDREFAIGQLVLELAILSSQYWAPHSKLTPFLRALQGQVAEFVAGFVAEIDFRVEAANQQRFYERSRNSQDCVVPMLFERSARILEMEYLADAQSLTHAVALRDGRPLRRLQQRGTRQLWHTLIFHMLVHGEMHGDLHPGNVMLTGDDRLALIDWGNVVSLRGKWADLRVYLLAALRADPRALAQALLRMSTTPQADVERYEALTQALGELLARRGVVPLSARAALRELRGEGSEAIWRRLVTVAHLVGNTQHVGIVMRRDYVHLTRALMAAAGAWTSLYPPGTRRRMLWHLGDALWRSPYVVGAGWLREGRRRWSQRPELRDETLPMVSVSA